MGKFSEQDIDRLELNDNELSVSDCDDFCVNPNGFDKFTESDGYELQIEALLSAMRKANERLDHIAYRHKYYGEAIDLDEVLFVRNELKRAIRDLA